MMNVLHVQCYENAECGVRSAEWVFFYSELRTPNSELSS